MIRRRNIAEWKREKLTRHETQRYVLCVLLSCISLSEIQLSVAANFTSPAEIRVIHTHFFMSSFRYFVRFEPNLEDS